MTSTQFAANRGYGPGSTTSGSVTVETSFGIISLLFVFGMLVQGLHVVALNGAIVSCARESARVATLQYDAGAARAAAIEQGRQCQPNSVIDVTIIDDEVTVDVRRGVRLFGLPKTVQLQGTATGLLEPAW